MSEIRNPNVDPIPHDQHAEECLIGSLLIDPDAIIHAQKEGLEATDFFGEWLGSVYGAVQQIARRYEEVTMPGIIEIIDGGIPSVTDSCWNRMLLLMERLPTSVYAGQYARLIKRLSQQRKLISAAGEIAGAAYKHEGPLDDLYNDVSNSLFAAIGRTQNASHLYGTDASLIEYEADQIELAARLKENPSALIRTYWPNVDRLLVSIPAGQLHIVGARTSVGKTIWLEQIAEQNAIRGHKVAFYHLELSQRAMQHRRMARYTGISMRQLRQGYNGPEIAQAADRLREWHGNLIYIHCPGWTAGRITADIMRLHALGECDLAIVDYLGKLPRDGGSGWANEASLIGQNVEQLKTCAERLGIPIATGSQVSQKYGRNERPHIDSLRGSGEINEKANQVVMLHAPEEREEGQESELIQVFVDKNTEGETGMMELHHRLGRYRLEYRTSEIDRL